MNYLLYLLFCHIIGWIMTGYIVIRLLSKDDIRLLGSRNIGALNSGRIAGTKAFVLTFLGDSLKGGAAVMTGIYFNLQNTVILLGLIAVVAGHIWPLPFKFRGGKGAATGRKKWESVLLKAFSGFIDSSPEVTPHKEITRLGFLPVALKCSVILW